MFDVLGYCMSLGTRQGKGTVGCRRHSRSQARTVVSTMGCLPMMSGERKARSFEREVLKPGQGCCRISKTRLARTMPGETERGFGVVGKRSERGLGRRVPLRSPYVLTDPDGSGDVSRHGGDGRVWTANRMLRNQVRNERGRRETDDDGEIMVWSPASHHKRHGKIDGHRCLLHCTALHAGPGRRLMRWWCRSPASMDVQSYITLLVLSGRQWR